MAHKRPDPQRVEVLIRRRISPVAMAKIVYFEVILSPEAFA